MPTPSGPQAKKHKRRSIRLKGYDYAQSGLYFITLCCQHRAHLFGEIRQGEMILNDAGQIADACWKAIPEHFPHAVLHEYVVMPDHVHGVIEIIVGAEKFPPPPMNDRAKNFSPRRSPSRTIGSIIRGFKIGVTKWMRQHTDVHDVWQRNYYEHIIRNELSYHAISAYIRNNPAKWNEFRRFKPTESAGNA